MQNFRALGARPPDPRAYGAWGLCPQTPSLRRLGLCPQTPIGLRRLGAPPPDPPNSPPIANFWLRAWLRHVNQTPGMVYSRFCCCTGRLFACIYFGSLILSPCRYRHNPDLGLQRVNFNFTRFNPDKSHCYDIRH